MIEIKNLCFSYSTAPTLKNICLKLETNKTYCIIGENGCGKTTLLRLLARLEKPSAGEITVDGKNAALIPRKEYAKLVSLLPQGRNIPNITSYDLVASGRFPYLSHFGTLSDEDRRIVLDSMNQTNTLEFANTYISSLSGGQRQQVYTAMALAQDTPYVLFDEPTTYLDIKVTSTFPKALSQLKEKGKTVISVLHDLPCAFKSSDFLIVMKDGEAVAFDTPENIASSGIITEIFGVTPYKTVVNSKEAYIFD